MILNKASFERGFAHASVYKCEVWQTPLPTNVPSPIPLQLIDLAKKARDHGNTYQFGESSIVTVLSCDVCVFAINRCSGR